MEKNTEMTVEKLEAYKGLVSNMQALQQEMSALRNTYKSPLISDVGSHVMSVGSPVQSAVSKILELEKIYNKEYEAAANLLYEIETFISQIEDPEIRSIIRFHYMLGYSWERTNTAICGYPSYYTARKRLMRYLGKEA